MEFFKKWLKAASVRAIKTFCQAALAAIATAHMVSTVDWLVVLDTAGLAAVLSMLTSLSGLPELKSEEAKHE